jgi:hypothetical protein
MSENLFLPNIPASPMFIGDDRIMTIEWQEFFRILTDRAGGVSAPTIDETDLSGVSELYSTPENHTKEIDELRNTVITSYTTPKNHTKEINELENTVIALHSAPKNYDKKINNNQARAYYFGHI